LAVLLQDWHNVFGIGHRRHVAHLRAQARSQTNYDYQRTEGSFHRQSIKTIL